MEAEFDKAQLPGPLAIDQGESNWMCAQLEGRGTSGVRRLAVLAWLHRTGPRLGRLDHGLGVLGANLLPSSVRAFVPSWLSIVTPFRLETDDRPLLLVAVFDLDVPELPPRYVEENVAHAAFEEATFSAHTESLALTVGGEGLKLRASTSAFALSLTARSCKRFVQFNGESPLLRHGDIEIGYRQRSRLRFSGSATIADETIVELDGDGAQDRHWRRSSPRNLAWIWIHLRLDNCTEINAYVIRDSRTPTRELGRAAWRIDGQAAVHPLLEFRLEKDGPFFVFASREAKVDVRFRHATRAPFIPLGAFGEALDGGIMEGPIEIDDGYDRAVQGWLELFDSSSVRARR